MGNHYRNYDNDYRERDATLRDLQTRLNRARVQRNKTLCIELEKAIRKTSGY